MEHRLCNSDWCALRRLLRHGRSVGRDLRSTRTRKTADGRFLKILRIAGLIRAVGPRNANPLNAVYEITPEGDVAAEYGFYDGVLRYGVCVATKGWHPGKDE